MTTINTAITGGVSSNLSPIGNCTFSGAQKGTVVSLGGGTFRYTPNSNTVGIDHFVATFTVPGMQMMGATMPPMTATRTVDMRIGIPYSPTPDNSYMYQDSTMTQPVSVNYFVLKGNTLSISAANGVLKNDAAPAYQQYLKAYKSSDGQYGTVSVSTNGGFVYTPNPGVFDSSAFGMMGLQDTFTYYVKDPLDVPSGPVTVKVDLAKVEISRNGVNVNTNPAQRSAWVGEKVAVSVAFRGQVGVVPGLISFQWNISGQVVDGYTGYGDSFFGESDEDPDTSEVAHDVPLTADELNNSSVDFYWTDKGAKEVSVSVSVVGQTSVASSEFDVRRPAVSVTVTTSGLRIVDNNRVTFSSPTSEGITFVRSLDALADTLGSYRWTQLITRDNYTWNDSTGSHTGYKSLGADNYVTYQNANQVIATDSPGSPLPASWTATSRDFGASMYLMWRHQSSDSIWIPLGFL